jgi:preprotein translocase subunit YajC
MFELDAHSLMLGQAGNAGLPGESTGSAGTPGDPGAPGTTGVPGGPGTGAPPSSPFSGPMIPIMLGLFVLMLIVSVIGPRRERKKKEAMINAIKKHDRVQTVGGVIGAIVELKPDFVVLKVDESANTRITFARSAIQQVLSASDGDDSSSSSSS